MLCLAAVVLIAPITNQDIRQVWNPEDAEEEVLVMVCRIGMHTSMGTIIRQLLTPTKVYKDKEPLLRVGCHARALLHDAAMSATLACSLAFRFCDSFLLFDLSHGFACAPALRNLVINQKPHF